MSAPFQLFDALDPATEAALRASIKRFGVIVPVVIDQRGRIIDGHHRKRIADELGLRVNQTVRRVRDDAEAEELARTLNEDRRQLDIEDRRRVVADLRSEGHSLRAIAGAVGVDAATVHRDLQKPGVAPATPGEVRGRDGKTYPARPAATKQPMEEEEPQFVDGEQEAIIDHLQETYGDDLTPEIVERALEENIESKQLPEPRPEWTPSKPDVGGGVSHPARYSDALIPLFADLLRTHSVLEGRDVLDPFAGTGRIHELRPDWDTWGLEIEAEWAELSEWTTEGSVLQLPWEADRFDAVVTSPTYGNRLADHHNASDPERRRSYTHDLGRPLDADNSGAMQWGDDYRQFHTRAWEQVARALKPGGVFLLNIKDHVRAGERQYVAGWHVTELVRLGFSLVCHHEVNTRSLRQGENGLDHQRLPELVYVLRKVS
jgi:transposase-like protein